jgi:hypothetical protein
MDIPSCQGCRERDARIAELEARLAKLEATVQEQARLIPSTSWICLYFTLHVGVP